MSFHASYVESVMTDVSYGDFVHIKTSIYSSESQDVRTAVDVWTHASLDSWLPVNELMGWFVCLNDPEKWGGLGGILGVDKTFCCHTVLLKLVLLASLEAGVA